MKITSIRLSEKILKELAYIAKKEDRSRNYIIVKVIEKYIKNYKSKNKKMSKS